MEWSQLEQDHDSHSLASVDIMFLAYAMVRIRPIVPNTFILQRLRDLQRLRNLDSYTIFLQLWLSGLTGLAECATQTQRSMWRSLVLVKIPLLARQFCLDMSIKERHECMEMALYQLSFFNGVLNECDEQAAILGSPIFISFSLAGFVQSERHDIFREIALCCRAKSLIRNDSLEVIKGNPFNTDMSPDDPLNPNVVAMGTIDMTVEAIEELCGRALVDYERQDRLVDRIVEICEIASSTHDVPTLTKICQTLDDNPAVLDLVQFLRSPSKLMVALEFFVNNLNQHEDDDIDTCNANLEGFGIVLILIVHVIQRYDYQGSLEQILKHKDGFCFLWLQRMSATIPHHLPSPTGSKSSGSGGLSISAVSGAISMGAGGAGGNTALSGTSSGISSDGSSSALSVPVMAPERKALMHRWILALFDSMGISDDLIQSSKPQMLMEISPAIFEESLAACQADVIDQTTLMGGLDYFLQPCLLFVLIGVIQYLCEEILYTGRATLSAGSLSGQHGGHGGLHSGANNSSNSLSGSGRPTPNVGSLSPLATRGGGGQTNTASNGGQRNLLGMQLSVLKSLLAGEAFPLRLMRLFRTKIIAALEVQVQENDMQMASIQERLDSIVIHSQSTSHHGNNNSSNHSSHTNGNNGSNSRNGSSQDQGLDDHGDGINNSNTPSIGGGSQNMSSQASVRGRQYRHGGSHRHGPHDGWSVSDSYSVHNLTIQTSTSFEAIVTSGRTSMIAKREKGWPIFGNTAFHIDVDLFKTTLTLVGPDQFVTILLKQILRAGQATAHGIRAAELGAAILTTPLGCLGDGFLQPQSLVWTLMNHTLWMAAPGRIDSFHQGKLLAAFVGLVLDLFQVPESLFSDDQYTVVPIKAVSLSSASEQQQQQQEVDEVDEIKQRNEAQRHRILMHKRAIEPFHRMLENRIKDLERTVVDRPGFKGFAEGIREHIATSLK